MMKYCSPFVLHPLLPISSPFFKICLTYNVLWSSWCGLRRDQPESGLCTGGHHADVSCDHPGWPGPAGAGGAREVWTGTADAYEWDSRGAEQGYHPHQWLCFRLWVIKIHSKGDTQGFSHFLMLIYECNYCSSSAKDAVPWVFVCGQWELRTDLSHHLP